MTFQTFYYPNESTSSGSMVKRVHGIVTAMVTPLTDAFELDIGGLETLISRQLEARIHGLFVLGSVGEGPILSDGISREVARRSVEFVENRCVVLGGASDNSTEGCLRRLDMLSKAGVDVGIVTMPYYGWPNRIEESVAFFRDVARLAPIPIMAYDLPKVVGWRMPLEMIEALFEIKNLIGLKCTHGDREAMIESCVSPKRPAGFSFLPGNSGLAVDMFENGADGLVCTPSNVCPKPFVQLYEAFQQKDTDKIEKLQEKTIPKLVQLLGILPNGAASIKAALEVMGIAGRFTTPPWPQASDADIATAQAILDSLEEEIA